jgi:predicted phage tail protein
MPKVVKSNQQFIFLHDAICEGPIEGLVYGDASVYLNDSRLKDIDPDSAYNPVRGTVTFSTATGTVTGNSLPLALIGTPENENFVILRGGAVAKSNATFSAGVFTITGGTFSANYNTISDNNKRIALVDPDTDTVILQGEGRNASGGSTLEFIPDGTLAPLEHVPYLGTTNAYNVELIEAVQISEITNSTTIVTTQAPTLGDVTYRFRITGSIMPEAADDSADAPSKTDNTTVQFRKGSTYQDPISELNGTATGIPYTANLSGVNPGALKQLDPAIYTTFPIYASDGYPAGEPSDFGAPAVLGGQALFGAAVAPTLDELRIQIGYNSLVGVDKENGDDLQNTSIIYFEIRTKKPGETNFGPYGNAFKESGTRKGQIFHTAKNKSPISFEHYLDLTPYQPFDDFEVRISKLTRHKGKGVQANGGNQFGDKKDQADSTATISVVTAINKDKLTYPYTAHAGVFLDSREFSSVPKRSYELRGMKVRVPTAYTPREYSSSGNAEYASFWDGSLSTSLFYTDNPAWVFYDIVINDRFGAGEWIKEEDIDLYALYRISKYCDELVPSGKKDQFNQDILEPRFRANVFLTKATDVYKVLKDMATIFTSMIYWMDGKMTTVLDAPGDPVYNFSKANVIDGQFTYESTGNKTKINQVVVTWNDPSAGYEQRPLVVEDRNSIIETGRIVKEAAFAFGCTSEGQARRYGKWKLFTSQGQTELVSFKAALDGAFLKPGDIIQIQDADRYGAKFSGRIVTATTEGTSPNEFTRVTLDRDVTLQGGAFTYNLSVLITEPAAFYIGEGSIIVNGKTVNRGDRLSEAYVDSTNDGTDNKTLQTIDTEAKASNAFTSASGEPIPTTWSDYTYVDTLPATAFTNNQLDTTGEFSTLPTASSVWMLQEFESGAQTTGSADSFRILGISQDDKNVYSITAVEHYNEKYDFIDDPDAILEIPEDVYPTEPEYITAPTQVYVLQNSDASRPDEELVVQWDYPEFVDTGITTEVDDDPPNPPTVVPYLVESARFLDGFEIYHNIPEVENPITVGKRQRRYPFRAVPDGAYIFRVRALSTSENKSQWTTARYLVDDPFRDNVNRIKGLQTEGLTTHFPYITNQTGILGNIRGAYDTSGSVTYSTNDVVTDGGERYYLSGLDANVGHVSVSADNTANPGTWTGYSAGILKFNDSGEDVVLAPSRFQTEDTVGLGLNYELDCNVMNSLGSDFPGIPGGNPRVAFVVLDHGSSALKLIKADFDDDLRIFYWQDLSVYDPTDTNAVWSDIGSATVAAGSNKVVGSGFTSLNNLNKLKFDDGTVLRGARVSYVESDTVLYLDRRLDDDNGFSGTVRVQQYAPDFRKDVILGQVLYNTSNGNYRFKNFLNLDPNLTTGRSVFLNSNPAFIQFDLQDEPTLVPDEIIVDATVTGFDEPEFKITYGGTGDPEFVAEDAQFYPFNGNSNGNTNPSKYTKVIYTNTGSNDLSYNAGAAYEITVTVREANDPGNTEKQRADTFTIAKVADVAAGTGAKFVNLQLEDYTIIYDRNGENPKFNGSDTNGDITFTAVASEGFADPLFQWSIGGTVVQSWDDPGAQSGSYDYTVPTTVGTASSYTWDDESGGSKTVKIEVAEKPDSWVQGVNDPSAAEAEDSDNMLAVRVGSGGIAISLTNDSHVVPCDKDGDPKTFANSGTNIEVFSGGVPLDFVDPLPATRVVGQWTVTGAASWVNSPSGTEVGGITSAGSTPERYAVVANHQFDGEVGNGLDPTETVTYTIVIPQEADNGTADLVLTRIQTFSLGLDGQDNTTQGASGVDSRAIKLSANQYVIKYDEVGGETDEINFQTEIQGVEDTAYYVFSVDGTQKQPPIGDPITTTGTFTLADTDEPAVNGAPVLVKVSLYEGTTAANAVLKASDSVNIYAVQDGSDSITGFLTNAAHVVSADKNGTVSSFAGAGGTFRVFKGSTNITTSCTFSNPSSSDVTASINPSTGVYSVSAMSASADQGTATFQAVIPGDQFQGGATPANDVAITADYSISKSKTGADGQSITGPDGDDGRRQYTFTYYYTVETLSSAASPTAPTITNYTFSSGAIAGSGLTGWSTTAPTLSAFNATDEALTWYAVTVTATESLNNGVATGDCDNSPGSGGSIDVGPVQAIQNFDGIH